LRVSLQGASDSRGGAQLPRVAAPGNAQDEEPLRSERLGEEALPAEGNGSGPPGRQPSPHSSPRRHGLRSDAARLLLQDELAGEEERAEVGAVAAGEGREARSGERSLGGCADDWRSGDAVDVDWR